MVEKGPHQIVKIFFDRYLICFEPQWEKLFLENGGFVEFFTTRFNRLQTAKSQKLCSPTKGYVYSACAALLDLENPRQEIARLPYPLFQPEREWELKGEVNNVCFPTGTALFGDTLHIYYGAADERIACASVSLSALLEELLLNTKKNEK